MSFAPGAVVNDRYEIRREIGRGGYSIVYLAHDRILFREVAIKLLVPPPAAAKVARERLRREVLAVRDLAHQHIVQIYDFLDVADESCIVMQYIAGPDLAIRVAERGPLAPELAARVGRHVAQALSVAHRHGILHRDVKPSNILLDAQDSAHLTDFGAAKLDGMSTVTATGGLVGTFDYLAPEVMAGHRGDARADIFALGMTLYFILTGRLPERPSPHLPPPPSPDGHRPSRWRPDIPAQLDDAIATATAALPADRFPSAALLADALSQEQTSERRLPRVSHHLTFCLLCGTDEPLGLGLCAGCAATAPVGSDGLLFIQPAVSPAEREHTRQRLRALAGQTIGPAALESVVRGERALARVPLAGADRVLARLSAAGITARVVRGPWAPLPWVLYGIAALMLVGGWVAGQYVPGLRWLSPILAAVVVFEAQRQARQPILKAAPRSSDLTGPAWHRLAETVGRLPAGTALSLLADLARNAQGVLASMDEANRPEGRAEVEELILHACDAATDLADLEDSLHQLERQRAYPGGGPSGKWNDAVARAERSRDALVQRLLDSVTALGEARVRTLEANTPGRERLTELSIELQREVSAYAEARREVEALL